MQRSADTAGVIFLRGGRAPADAGRWPLRGSMKVALNKTALVQKILVMLACAIFATTGCLEFRHWYYFGHLVSYGLHVDVRNEDFNIAIPGQTKLYWAEISNFSFFPVQLPACRPIGDTLDPPIEYPYVVQRFDSESKSWQTIVDTTKGGYCLPPFSRKITGAFYTNLMPGSSVKVMSGEATGAREPFRKGDLARFVVFRTVSPDGDWKTAVSSMPFQIEDDVLRDTDGSFRVQH